jgi:hypothetical protein
MTLLFEDILHFIVEISANQNPVKLARFRKFEPFPETLAETHSRIQKKNTPRYFAPTNFVVVPTAHHLHGIKHRCISPFFTIMQQKAAPPAFSSNKRHYLSSGTELLICCVQGTSDFEAVGR